MRLRKSRLRSESKTLSLMKMRRAKRKSRQNLKSQMASRKRTKIANPAQTTLMKVMKTVTNLKDKP